MYIVKNALRNLLRSKGRNILIGLIVLVIAVASCLALSIRQAAVTARESGLENLAVTAQISLDRQAMLQKIQQGGGDMKDAFQNMTALSLEEMQTYAKSQYVKDFTYTLTTSLNAGEGLEAVDTSGSSDSGDNAQDQQPPNLPDGGMGGRFPLEGMGAQGDFTLVGYSSHSAMTAFVAGTCQVTDGEVFDEAAAEPVCLISDELATLNGLQVGDTLALVNPNDETETVTLTIAGLYHNSAAGAEQGGMMKGFSAASDPANQVYLSYPALKAITDASAAAAVTSTDEETGVTSTTALRAQTAGVYSFADTAAYEAFQADARAMGLSEDYAVTSTDVEAYEQSLLPLQNLSKFAVWFLLVVLLIGGAILIVFHIFNIRERKYEIGVLTAIGMRKSRVALQFLTELFVVTFAFLLLGTAIGGAASVPVTNALLASQISAQETQQSNQQQNFGRPGDMGGGTGGAPAAPPSGGGGFFGMGRQMVNYLSDVSSATDWVVVLQLLGIGLALTLLSACVAVASVMRYEPLKILSERG